MLMLDTCQQPKYRPSLLLRLNNYSGDLKSEFVQISKRGWCTSGPDFKWDLKVDTRLPFCQTTFEIQHK